MLTYIRITLTLSKSKASLVIQVLWPDPSLTTPVLISCNRAHCTFWLGSGLVGSHLLSCATAQQVLSPYWSLCFLSLLLWQFRAEERERCLSWLYTDLSCILSYVVCIITVIPSSQCVNHKHCKQILNLDTYSALQCRVTNPVYGIWHRNC